MKTEIKIIKALIEGKEMTIRELSKKIKADYRITHTAMQRLVDKDIVIMKTVGKSSLCSLNKSQFSNEIYLAEEERKGDLLKNKDIKQLYKEVMSKSNTTFFIFLVFGSYAKKLNTKNSDIDLLFISNEKNFENKIDRLLSLLPIKTHALVFSEDEFRDMLYDKKSNVVKEAVNNYIILYGIESFYRLKNA